MSTTIDIPDEVYAQLEREAKARGLTVSQTIVQCLEESERARIAVAVERLRTKGILLAPTVLLSSPSVKFAPIHVQGQPLSEVIIEERR
jgi:hypothetical protein